jgi:hypothetical protein
MLNMRDRNGHGFKRVNGGFRNQINLKVHPKGEHVLPAVIAFDGRRETSGFSISRSVMTRSRSHILQRSLYPLALIAYPSRSAEDLHFAAGTHFHNFTDTFPLQTA